MCLKVYKRNKNIKLFLNYVIGPLVFLILGWSIYRQILRQPDWQQSANELKGAVTGNNLWMLAAVLLLMLINWSLEARKWQIVVNKLEPAGFITALKSVFTGNTLAFFTPNRLGEYVGRMVYISEGKRAKSIALTVVCSLAQVLVTFLFGLPGLLFFLKEEAEIQGDISDIEHLFDIGYWVVIVITFLLLILYFRIKFLTRLPGEKGFFKKLLSYIQVLENFNATILLRLLSLSCFRYIVFILQYYLLFSVFGVELSYWECYISISVVFLLLAIIPTLAAVADLGIRWKASIGLVSVFSGNSIGILAASFSIWLINLVIPSIIGGVLLLGVKLFNNKKV